MEPNPISYAEIEAYQRVTGNRLSPWGVDLIRRLDRAALAAVRKTVAAAPTADAAAEIPVTDTKAVSSLFGRLKARANAAHGSS